MKTYEVIICIGGVSGAIGSVLMAFVQQRHASRHGRFYRSLLVKPDADDCKLLEIGIPLFCIGVILILIGDFLKPY